MIKITVDAPEDILDTKSFIESSIKAVNDTVDDTLRDFNLTKAPFDHQFEFVVKKASKPVGGIISGSVGTDDENYVRLNNGFTIKGVSGKLMSFQPTYVPKTFPNTIRSRSGGSVGPRIVRMSRKGPTEVQARNFDLVIAAKQRPVFFKRVLGG
jgi:hypothetical protein